MKKTIVLGVLGLVCGALGETLGEWSHHLPLQINAIFFSAVETSIAMAIIMNLIDLITTPKSRHNQTQVKSEAIKLTVKEAMNQLMIVAGNFSDGKGETVDILAQRVLQSLQVLQRLLSDSNVRVIYLEDHESRNVFPEYIMDTLHNLNAGRVSRAEACQQIAEAIKIYQNAFEEMGISPQAREIFFVK